MKGLLIIIGIFALGLITLCNNQNSTTTITLTVGQREGSFLMQKVNPDSIEGLWYEKYPVETLIGSLRILHIGDNIGYACEGIISEKLTSIDFPGKKAIFTKTVSKPPEGGCPL